MDSKLMAQVFNDVISAAQRSTMVGEGGKNRRGYITVNSEVIEAMLYAQKKLQCSGVSFGSYACCTSTMFGFDVDGCLVTEINGLNNDNVKTIGCCCGHGKKQGFIQVAPEYVDKMLELGYEQLPVDADGNGQWCFKPKTILPR